MRRLFFQSSTHILGLLGLVCLVTLNGCGSTKLLQHVSAPGGDKALVYFIRKSYPPYVYALRLNVNGVTLATISNNDFVAVNVPVGKNSVLVDVTDGKPLSFEMSVEKADTRYVVLTGDVSKTGQGITGYTNLRST
jgi:hypothetical protein